MDQAKRPTSEASPCKNRGTIKYAGVVELVDSLDLGSNAQACRFESCHPHQKKARFGVLFLPEEYRYMRVGAIINRPPMPNGIGKILR